MQSLGSSVLSQCLSWPWLPTAEYSGWLAHTAEAHLLTVLEAGSPSSRYQHSQFAASSLPGSSTATFTGSSEKGKENGQSQPSGVSSSKGTNPSVTFPNPNYLPRAPSLNAITRSSRDLTCECGGDTVHRTKLFRLVTWWHSPRNDMALGLFSKVRLLIK